jgi:small subunit ribosomal protein S2
VDSNVDPVSVALPIPGNDDSMRSCELVISTVGEGIEQAATAYREAEAKRRAEEEERRRREAEEKARREAEEKARQEAEEAAAKAAEAQAAASASAGEVGGQPQPQQPAAPKEPS